MPSTLDCGVKAARVSAVQAPDQIEHRVVVAQGLSRQEAEALYLELRQLAARYGLELVDFRVRPSPRKRSA